jgi:hypothetical protein
MNFTKGILLGSAASILSIAAASAADLPSRKSAPVEYVKVCSAYGAGFFFIPGTDTCLRVTGRVRADYAYSPAKTTLKVTAGEVANDKVAAGQNESGTEARARIGFDVRTATAYGTVQSVGVLRMARSSGLLSESGAPKDGAGDNAWISDNKAAVTLETAYIRFAGFTFGAARDNFAFMPSLTYGAGHWASFANGAKQLAYTATFGGGVSATIALQDYNDTTAQNKDAVTLGTHYYRYTATSPQVNATLNLNQGWGNLQVMGAFASPNIVNAAGTLDVDTTVYAIGAGTKINLPMLAKGSALYLTAAYADGMTEYTTNWSSFKSSAQKREVGGFVVNHPSFTMNAAGTSLENVKSWGVAGLLEHYWAPQYRSVLFGGYGQIDASAGQKASVWDGKRYFGDATVWNIGKGFAWLPARNFEIGVEVTYARVSQDVTLVVAGDDPAVVARKSAGNVTGRLRVERNF